MTAVPNKSVRGLDVIDGIKKHLEAACPGTVSCADVIALAARDAITTVSGARTRAERAHVRAEGARMHYSPGQIPHSLTQAAPLSDPLPLPLLQAGGY